MRLQIIGYYPKDDGIYYFDFSTGRSCEILDTDETFGYLSFVPFRECGWEDGIRRIAGFRKPISLLDNTGELALAKVQMKNSSLFQLFSMGMSPKAGSDMARFLLSIGHKKVAFISAFQKSDWSVNRYLGLEAVFEKAGFAGGVQAITLDFANTIEFQAQCVALSKIEVVLESYKKIRATIPSCFSYSFDTIFHLDEGVINMALAIGGLRKICQSLFEKALADPSISAWVCANDYLAVQALEFLRARNISYPGTISVLGFDDNRAALQNKVTSYNFNIPAIVNAMLRHIFNERFPHKLGRRKTIEVDGVVIERGSSAKRER